MKIILLVAATVVVLGGAGCTFPSHGRVVRKDQVGQMQRIEYGTIEKISNVVIEGDHNGHIGIYGGGLTGAAAASGVGHGAGNELAKAGGAVTGAVTGAAVEEAVTRKPALEMTIRLESGGLVVLTQETPPAFNVGDRVAIAVGGGASRVLPP